MERCREPAPQHGRGGDAAMNTMTRRYFFGRAATGVGLAALSTLDAQTHFPARAKRVIYLFQSGGPSQMETIDYKPRLVHFHGTDLPASILQGQRLTIMSSSQQAFPVVPSKFAFARHGQSVAWVSELLPHTAKVA